MIISRFNVKIPVSHKYGIYLRFGLYLVKLSEKSK